MPGRLQKTAEETCPILGAVRDLFLAVTVEIMSRLSGPTGSDFSRQHLSNTAWAFATVGYEGGSLFLSTLARALTDRAAECNPQEISNTVWAFAKLRAHPHLLTGISEQNEHMQAKQILRLHFVKCSREGKRESNPNGGYLVMSDSHILWQQEVAYCG